MVKEDAFKIIQKRTILMSIFMKKKFDQPFFGTKTEHYCTDLIRKKPGDENIERTNTIRQRNFLRTAKYLSLTDNKCDLTLFIDISDKFNEK